MQNHDMIYIKAVTAEGLLLHHCKLSWNIGFERTEKAIPLLLKDLKPESRYSKRLLDCTKKVIVMLIIIEVLCFLFSIILDPGMFIVLFISIFLPKTNSSK